MAVNGDERNYGDQQDNPSGVGQNMRDLGNQMKNAKNGANSAKGIGTATNTGKEMVQNAAQNAVQNAATTATSTAVSTGAGVASGAAAGSVAGPVGTAVGAAWGLRHSIVKVLGAIGVIFLAFLCFFHSMPEIIYYSVFGFDGGTNEGNYSIEENYTLYGEAIQDVIDDAYAETVERAKDIIIDGGYDYDISLLNIEDKAKDTANYDVAYLLAVYSVMLGENEEPSIEDLTDKLKKCKSNFFSITSEEKKEVTVVPTEYWTYEPHRIPVVTEKRYVGTVNGVKKYHYSWDFKTVYYRTEQLIAEETITVDRYKQVVVETGTVNPYNYYNLQDVHNYTCYVKDGTTTVSPTETEVKYISITINPFDNSALTEAFGYEPDAIHGTTGLTNAEIVETQSDGLKSLIFGSYNSGDNIPLTDMELLALVNGLECNETRKSLVQTALTLVGKVPYFWGGKSPAGWNEKWGQPTLVTASGSFMTGTIMPYGLDCSGFTDWTYKTTLGITLYEGSWKQVQNCHPISKDELKSGDLGFLFKDDGVTTSHVLLFVDYDDEGNRIWVHCTYPAGVVVNTPYYDYKLKLYRPNNVDFGDE